MSTGSGGSVTGLLLDTSLADLETAYRDREAEAATLAAAGHDLMSLALRLYSLEIRVKTIVCKKLNLNYLPKHCKTHDLAELLIFTGLFAELDDAANDAIRKNWDLLLKFSKDRLNNLRYLPSGRLPDTDRDELIEALDDPNHGVLPWLSRLP